MNADSDRLRAQDLHTRGRRIWLALFVASLLATYGVYFTGNIVSGDNLVQYYQTTEMLDRHRATFSLDDVVSILRKHDAGLNTRFVAYRDGTFGLEYGLGQSLMTAPIFATLRTVKHALGREVPTDLTLWCMAWPFFATAGVLLTLAICRLTRVTGAVWTTLITATAAFASPIWIHADIPFNVVGDMLVTFAATAVCLWLQAFPEAGDRRQIAMSVLLAAILTFGIVTRPFFSAALPAFICWFLLVSRHPPARLAARPHVVAFVLGLAAGCGLIAAMNAHAFGSPFRSSYAQLGDAINFNGPWLHGMRGIFLNPLTSPFYFFPLIAVVPIVIWILARRRDAIALFAILFALPQVILMAKYSIWEGGPDLFDRFWLWLVPIVLLMLAAAVGHLQRESKMNATLLALTLSCFALGVRSQILTAGTTERDIYEQVASDARRSGLANELDSRDRIANLLTGRTSVARAQWAAYEEPRRFLFFRNVSRPIDRLWAALAGVLSAVLSLAAFCRAGDAARRTMEAAE